MINVIGEVMELNDIKELKKIKLISSTESNCYVYKDIIYKVFKNRLIARDRLDIIKFFLENDVLHCPKLYDLIYNNNEIIGYSMQYYKKAMSISRINRFNLSRSKCLELIDVYLALKDDNSLCYIDFNRNNVFVNNNKILLLDIDSCLKRTLESEQVSKEILKEFILGIIYKTYFFDYETYFTSVEREQIRNILSKNIAGENIDSIDDLRKFVVDVSKNDVNKVLKRLHYKIR